MKKFFKTTLLAVIVSVGFLSLTSCGGARQYLVVPHSVSTASAVTVNDLRLKEGQYDVLRSITESASVICEYKNDKVIITSGEGDFQYEFYIGKFGWGLKKFSGAASMGYFTNDLFAEKSFDLNAEEFARRVAMARIIKASKDYHADGVVEPVVISNVTNLGKDRIEFSSTVTAKLIVIKPTN